MRTLYILRGCPGSGKSTWVKGNHLEAYTLAADNIRLEYQSPVLDIHGNISIPQKNNGIVWRRLREYLEQRMERGDFTIIDATHYRYDFLNQYIPLIKKYNYSAYIVDFTNIPINTILQQNRKREEYKFVPEDRIHYMYRMIASSQQMEISKLFQVITPKEAIDLLYAPMAIDLNSQYVRIVVFGEIHGNFDLLQKYFAKFPYDEHTLYIFTGDYVDCGAQNKEVLQFFIENLDKKNFLFIEGNQEIWLRFYSENLFHAIDEIKSINKKDVRRFCSKLLQMVYVKYGSNTYCITHGGIPVAPSIFMPANQMIEGVGRNEDIGDIYTCWEKHTPRNHILIHGHRNPNKIDTKVNDRIYNLCADGLRVLHIKRNDQIDVMEFFQ